MLRAIASVAVAVTHIVQTALAGAYARRATDWDTLGVFGVGLFFVISGFCIHAPLVRRELEGGDPRIDYRAFYRRRFVRLYPAHLGALLLSVLAAALVPTPPGAVSLVSVTTPAQLGAHIFMVHTFDHAAFHSGNAVLWTLAIETHFYLAYPLFLALRRRLGTVRVLLLTMAIAVGLSVAGRIVGGSFDLVTASALARWWEWILGCLVVETVLSRKPIAGPSYLSVIALTLGTLALGIAMLHVPGGSAARGLLWPPSFAAVIVAASWMRPPEARALPRALLTIGHASYSLYLIHPIAYHLGVAALFACGASPPALIVGLAAAGAALTWAYYIGVERPLMNRAMARS
jgi:peptidoglycan/LPS O-acetylase OafA/YrhL